MEFCGCEVFASPLHLSLGRIETVCDELSDRPNFEFSEHMVVGLTIDVLEVCLGEVMRLVLLEVCSEGPYSLICPSYDWIESLSSYSKSSLTAILLEWIISIIDDSILFILRPLGLNVGIEK